MTTTTEPATVEPATTETPAQQTADNVYDTAADLLEYIGWTQDCEARDIDGDPTHAVDTGHSPPPVSFCLWGALAVATRRLHPHTTAWNYSKLIIDADQLGINTTDWNDHPNRTKTDVVAHLRALAAIHQETP